MVVTCLLESEGRSSKSHGGDEGASGRYVYEGGGPVNFLLEQATTTFIDHVNEFVADLEMAWGYKILYKSARTAMLTITTRSTYFYSTTYRYITRCFTLFKTDDCYFRCM